MKKEEIVKAIASTLGVDESSLTKALTSDEEVEISIPVGIFIPDAEKEDYEARLKKTAYNEGKETGVEMAIKEWKKKEGIDVEGKSMEVLINAIKEKAVKEVKVPTDEKVSKLTTDLEALRNTYQADVSMKDSEIQKLQGALKGKEIDHTLRGFIPDGLSVVKPDHFMHIAKHEYTFDLVDGQMVAKKGDQIITDKLQKPRPVNEILTEYAAEQGWLKENGRAGGNEPGGKSETFKTKSDVYGYLVKERIDPMSPQGQKLLKEFEE